MGKFAQAKKILLQGIFNMACRILLVGIIVFLPFIIWWQPIDLGKIKVKIDRGASAKEISHRLYQSGILRSKMEFLFFSKLMGKDAVLKPGVYHIRRWANPVEIISLLSKGPKDIRVVIPEGFNLNEIATCLEKNGLISKERFLLLCRDYDFIYSLGIETPPKNLEGYLFPDTYFLSPTETEEEIIRRFVNNLLYHLRELGVKEQIHKVLTIASLVEKEAKFDFERRKIAAVFLNRLKSNLPLESCATVQYALGFNKERLSENDLKIDSPYNTYLYKGLPPGPICSPGAESIKAVLNPHQDGYLYFVSLGNGTHHFAKSYKEHLIMKRRLKQ